jgi:hypothetical protein
MSLIHATAQMPPQFTPASFDVHNRKVVIVFPSFFSFTPRKDIRKEIFAGWLPTVTNSH